MSTRGLPAPRLYRPARYWEERARRFATERDGLAAVCAYGMPEFYNRAIDLEQRWALEPWMAVGAHTRVLDVGCGVGRWSRRLAARGAQVLGIDISPTMIAEARRRARADGVAGRCRFEAQNVSALRLDQQFDLVLSVTVLQHILAPDDLRAALRAMHAHLAPGGRMILLEAAPVASMRRCDSTVFTARGRDAYLQLIRECGLELRALAGVDPAPFRMLLLPHLRSLPRGLTLPLLALATAVSLPLDLLFSRGAARHSWHAVFVLQSSQQQAPHGH